MPFLVIILFCFFNTLVAQDSSYRVVIHTHEGDIELQIDANKFPHTIQRFIDFNNQKLYNNVVFNTVVHGFFSKIEKTPQLDSIVSQNPLDLDTNISFQGFIPAGSITMIHHRNKVGYQIFFNHINQPVYPLNATTFGKITSGFDVLTRIEKGDPIISIDIFNH